jgi:hypothetical protein
MKRLAYRIPDGEEITQLDYIYRPITTALIFTENVVSPPTAQQKSSTAAKK